jgi:hypothetical protein
MHGDSLFLIHVDLFIFSIFLWRFIVFKQFLIFTQRRMKPTTTSRVKQTAMIMHGGLFRYFIKRGLVQDNVACAVIVFGFNVCIECRIAEV